MSNLDDSDDISLPDIIAQQNQFYEQKQIQVQKKKNIPQLSMNLTGKNGSLNLFNQDNNSNLNSQKVKNPLSLSLNCKPPLSSKQQNGMTLKLNSISNQQADLQFDQTDNKSKTSLKNILKPNSKTSSIGNKKSEFFLPLGNISKVSSHNLQFKIDNTNNTQKNIIINSNQNSIDQNSNIQQFKDYENDYQNENYQYDQQQNDEFQMNNQINYENQNNQSYNNNKNEQSSLYERQQQPLMMEDEILSENIFYYSERKLRKIYSDKELHSNILALIISLLLTPVRGTLDDTYCSQNPVSDGKVNILYLLHFHINHPSNEYMLPLLLKKISYIKPYPSGQRLLKLLCSTLTNVGIYKNWQKINAGAFGTIFSCDVDLANPQQVAIKQMSIPKQIFDRCVLYDIFSEITCLENFRLDPCVTDLYDYGVTGSDYVIVMKKYQTSLKQWRLKQQGNWKDNLNIYLTLYKDILKAVQLLHSHNVTHYDIKADNILIEQKQGVGQEIEYKIVLADFGSCKLFKNEEDEYDQQNRGTEYIQSPEMLTLAIKKKRETDTYDRRRKVGSNRSSDIWSLGCLLYEILTGDFLFQKPNWGWPEFFCHLTDSSKKLLETEMLEKIDNNTYITDFLNFIFMRQQNIRPSIESVIKRFEHIYALLVPSNSTSNTPDQIKTDNSLNNKQNQENQKQTKQSTNLQYQNQTSMISTLPNCWDFEKVVQSYQNLVQNGVFYNDGDISDPQSPYKQFQGNSPVLQFPKISKNNILKHNPTYLKIMEEIYICGRSYFLKNQDYLIQNGVTHIITISSILQPNQLDRFQYLFIMKDNIQKEFSITSPFKVCPQVMDYLRSIFLFRGKVIFIEEDNIKQNSQDDKFLLRNILQFCLTYFFKCSVFETWTLINSQVMFFYIPFQNISIMSQCINHILRLEQFLDTYPKAQCICGCTTIILKKSYQKEKKIQTQICSCSSKQKNNANYNVECPSDGCQDYLNFIKKRYKLQWESLKWGYIKSENFLIGPYNSGQVKDDQQIQLILNSQGPAYNCTPHINLQKQRMQKDPKILQSDWTIHKCKICHMYMYALNNKNSTVALVMNNLIKRSRYGIMIPNALQNYKIKTPVLRNFNLYELK